MIHELDLDAEFREENSATYCPEDNKLRLYIGGDSGEGEGRVQRDTYLYLCKTLDFKASPKQDCNFVATWSPAAEDACLALIADWDDIGDEDYSPQERAADRAERFSGYRDKRRRESLGFADEYESGPKVFGNQSQARADRAARKHERVGDRAVRNWGKAEYWQTRTQGVISHALHRSSASVRRNRIKRLETELRLHLRDLTAAQERWDKWVVVRDTENELIADKVARALAGQGSGWGYKHPRKEDGRETSLWSLLTDTDDPITPKEAAELFFDGRDDDERPGFVGGRSWRWTQHYELRIAYEKQMIGEQGGCAADVEMVVGGFVGKHQIWKVNKSKATGKVVSVGIWGPHPWRKGDDGEPEMGVQTVNVERFGEGIYRAPTDDDLAEFKKLQKEMRAKAKDGKPKAPQLINPTNEDAERLQAIWNARHAAAVEKYKAEHPYCSDAPPSVQEVCYCTQEQYSRASKGSYGSAETVSIHASGYKHEYRDRDKTPIVFKVRKTWAKKGEGYTWSNAPNRVIVLTDKPQKPIPWDLMEVEEAVASE